MKTRKTYLKKQINIEDETKEESMSKSLEEQKWSIEKLSTSYIPGYLQGRNEEKEQIFKFIKQCLLNKTNCKVLYISGVPGVGKTAITTEIIKKIQKEIPQKKIKCRFINALTLKYPTDIYRIVSSFLCQQTKKRHRSKSRKNKTSQQQNMNKNLKDKWLATIEENISKLQKMHVLVIDQADYLLTPDQMIFYNLFQWASQTTQNFSLIIIGNTMNFPQKFTTKVRSRMGNNRLVFKPYSHSEIGLIVEQRLKDCNLFTNQAVTFACKKMATFTTDLRVVLQVLKIAVEQNQQKRNKNSQDIQSKRVKKDHKKQVQKQNANKKNLITIQNISSIWDRKFTTQKDKLNREQPYIFRRILELVRLKGGECYRNELNEILSQEDITFNNLRSILKDMQQMNLINLKNSVWKSCQDFKIKIIQS